MDPINYSSLLTPVQSPTAGIDQFQAQQQASAARALAANQIQMQLRQQALQQAALSDAIQNPSTQSYNNYLLVNPQAHEAIQAAHNNLDTDTQRQQLQDLTAVQGYLGAKQTDNALAIVQKHIDAAKKAGQDPTAFTTIQNLIKTDPDRANALVGITLAGTVGADKMAQTQASVGQETRAQAGFPAEQALKQAQTAEALANAQSKVSPPAETAVNPATGAYYNPKAAPPSAAISSNNGALDGFVSAMTRHESGGNATATNPNSSATGAGQFLSGTWVPLISQLHPELVQGKSQQQILDLRNNPNLAAEATAAYAQDNAQKLGAASLPVNNSTLAMAHLLGPQGAQAVLAAQANTPLAKILPPEVIKANPQLAKLTAGQYGQGLAREFGTTPIDTNPGDPNASGDDFLRTLSPQRAALVKAIAEGNQPGPTGRSAATGPGAFLMGQVQQYDPTATSINLPVRQATRKAFTSGTQGQSIVQAGTVGGHLAALDALTSSLDNGDIPFLNAAAQGIETALGVTAKQKAVTSFNTLSNTLASELTKFYRNAGGSEQDVNEFRKQLNVANSPTQIHTAIQQMAGAVLSKLDALNQSYNTGMGLVDGGVNLPNLNHNAIGQLQKLAGDSSFGSQQASNAPPAQAIQMLQANPALGAAFDAKYGPGASQQYLRR